MAQVAPLMLAPSPKWSDLPKPAQGVAFGRVAYALAWVGLYGLHVICVAYLTIAGYIYAKLDTTYVFQALKVYQLTLDARYLPVIAGVHFALASIHGYLLLQPLAAAAASVVVPPSLRKRVADWIETASLRRLPCRVPRLASYFYNVLLARDGVFGVRSAYFELLFLAREVVETVLQTHQAYFMSCLLPREKLNGFYTLILVVDCWATPLLRRVCRGNKPLERLLVVLCDILLDFISAIGVPAVVAIGYLQQYDAVITDFVPWTLYYTDVWLLNYLNEMPLVTLGSWLDAVSRLVFSLGLLLSMSDAKTLITRPAPRDKETIVSSISYRTLSSKMMDKLKAPELQARISKWVHRVMIVWGIGIAVMHFEAYARASPAHCSLALRPWLVSKPACAVVALDCRTHPHMSGDAADFEAVYSVLDAKSVQYVIFRHCSQVEFTPRLLTFRNLVGAKTHNSTIVTWNLDAAFTATAHPNVCFVYMTLTQFPNATLPLGLQHEQFPVTLTDIEISVSNIQWIPSTLPWPRHMVIGLEFSQLTEFPLVFVHLEPCGLSLAFNRITEVPVEAIMMTARGRAYLRGNPIQALPDTGVGFTGEYAELTLLALEYTNVTTLPAWVTASFLDHVQVFAAQSPLCVRVLQNASSPERELWLQESPWLAHVEAYCGEDPGMVGLYPLEVDAD